MSCSCYEGTGHDLEDAQNDLRTTIAGECD